jgi:hypothetical protein
MELAPIACAARPIPLEESGAMTASRSPWAQFAGLKGTSRRRAIGLAERRISSPKGVAERRFYSPV